MKQINSICIGKCKFQYICGMCGRCICIESEPKINVRRWNLAFKPLEIAKLFLRTGDYIEQSCRGLYEIVNGSF